MNRHFFRSFYLLIAVVAVMASTLSRAQQPQLSISFINLPDTVYSNVQYDTLHVTITNTSNNIFNDSLAVFIQQDTIGVGMEELYSGPATIAPGATVTLQLDSGHMFSPLNFKAGGNTVVIWPMSLNAVTIDSLPDYFYFVDLSGTDDKKKKENELLVFPNPVKDYMILETKLFPGDVRIYNVEGRLVYDKPYKEKRIDVASLPPGVYLVEYKGKNKQRSIKKILKL